MTEYFQTRHTSMLVTIQCSQLLHLGFFLLGASGSTISNVIRFPCYKKLKKDRYCLRKYQILKHPNVICYRDYFNWKIKESQNIKTKNHFKVRTKQLQTRLFLLLVSLNSWSILAWSSCKISHAIFRIMSAHLQCKTVAFIACTVSFLAYFSNSIVDAKSHCNPW